MLSHAFHWPGLALSTWAVQCCALFLAPFLHEDAAIVTGGVLVTERGMPFLLAAASLFTGIVASDVCLYGLGVVARRHPRTRRFLRRFLLGRHTRQIESWLGAHLVPVVAVCRVLPGLLSPVFISCGMLNLSFRRFAVTTTVTALIYTAGLLALVSSLGSSFAVSRVSQVGVGLLVIAALARMIAARRPQWKLVERIFAPPGVPRSGNETPVTHQGMPALSHQGGNVALGERIPPVLFYTPLVIGWLFHSIRYRCATLPALANPCIVAGGLWGESKSGCLAQIGAAAGDMVARFTTLTATADPHASHRQALETLSQHLIGFPLVAKPDVGWQGFGVRLLADAETLFDYISRYPVGERIILQEYVPYDGEAGVLYVRPPGQAFGSICSLALRYFPFVVGDGLSTVAALIERDERMSFKAKQLLGTDRLHGGLSAAMLSQIPAAGEIVRLALIGSIRTGALYRDGRRHITAALAERIDALAQSMPEFHFGRFDIRFRSIEAMERGEFKVFEVNGAGSEAIHVWDPAMRLPDVYRELFRQQALLFQFGAANHSRGFQPMSVRALLRLAAYQNRLVLNYPPSS